MQREDIARFWEYSLPPIYDGVVRSVAQSPGRSVGQNARLFAATAQAMDDAMISVFDAKYHYHFWRSSTAIRNADADQHEATERDATWTPFIDTPMHREDPAGHSILAGTVRAVLKAEVGAGHRQPDGERRGAPLEQHRGLHAGSRAGAHLRRHALSLFNRGRDRDGIAATPDAAKCRLDCSEQQTPKYFACWLLSVSTRFSQQLDMTLSLKSSTKRILALLALLPATLLLLGTIYMLGMEHLEGTPRTLFESLVWASESITSTGYGFDNHWKHPAMVLFVILSQFTGQFLLFLIFPIFLLPYFEERFEVRLQHVLPPMEGKVLFYRYSPAIESVVEELQRTANEFVIFEEDMTLARDLRDRGYNVVFGKLADDPSILARVRQARAVVANAGDHGNATCTLMVRELGFTGPLYALADEPLYRPPMIQIGATEVFTPAHVLGAALASHASLRISPAAEGMHLLGTEVGMAEFRVREGSPLAGKRLGEVRLRERHGVSVIGQWRAGSFATTKGPETQIEPGAILVVVGAHANLEKVERMAMPIRRTGSIVLAGYGAVGHKVIELLLDAGETCVVIDRAPAPGVDVVGNVLERSTLDRAKVRQASAVILALSDDSESMFATAAVRDYAPEVPLIVRVLRSPNTSRLYRAGADFAVSIGQVAGQILAFHLLGEHVVSVENRIKFSRMSAGTLAGAHPWHSEALDRTGAKIFAVERGRDVIVEFDDEFRLRPDDVAFIGGSIGCLERYQREFQAKPSPAKRA